MILLAVLIVLMAVFIPRALQKKEMRALLAEFASGEITYLLLCDPMYENQDLFGNRGKEIRLDEEQIAFVQARLDTIQSSKLSGARTQTMPVGSFDLQLILRKSDGSTARLYFPQGGVAYLDKTELYVFTDTEGRCEDLRTKLAEWLLRDAAK